MHFIINFVLIFKKKKIIVKTNPLKLIKICTKLRFLYLNPVNTYGRISVLKLTR